MRTLAEINDKITRQQAVVRTVEEVKAQVIEMGVAETAKAVDVVTTGTFEPMESSGAMLNLGQTDPPIKIRQCWLDGVSAYAGFGAVDLYLGASQMVEYANLNEVADSEEGRDQGQGRLRGGGHVIEDLIAGKSVHLRALGQGTDCYPRSSFETTITRDRINQFYLFNPRNLYQNFIVGVNGGDRPLFTYLGALQPQLGNAVYANPGAISPLLNFSRRRRGLRGLGRYAALSLAETLTQSHADRPRRDPRPDWRRQTHAGPLGARLLLQGLRPLPNAGGRHSLTRAERIGDCPLRRAG
jgi:L-aspartate semialdehyde sulfurtransferase